MSEEISRKFKVYKINSNRQVEMVATIKTKPISTFTLKRIVKEELKKMSDKHYPHEDVFFQMDGEL